MKVVKNINNNVSLCLDSKGREVIAFGKGLGFIKPPFDVPLHKVDRTFYNIKDIDYEGIKKIPIAILNASIRIVDEVEENLNVTLMSNSALALADHIHFAIQRLNEHIVLEMPIQEDMKQLYPDEMREAYRAIRTIYEETGVTLDQNEACSIAFHFVNNQISDKANIQQSSEEIIAESISIIEQEYEFLINKESFNYSRFVTHLDYLLRRTLKNHQIKSINNDMFEVLKEQYPDTYICAVNIRNLFEVKLNLLLNDEETLYLMLHINRLCSREEVTK